MTATEYPNWFAQIAQYNFERFLLPEANKPERYYLQLGAFTGDASVWLLENILTDKTSYLLDIDTWEGAPNEPIQTEMDFEDVFNTWKKKTEKYSNIGYYRQTTQSWLLSPPARMRENSFDFIYVDAHHTSASAFLDSELSWPLLRSGGMLAIDDYEWVHPDGNPIHAPKLGIEMFLDRHKDELEVLAINSQCWVKKK